MKRHTVAEVMTTDVVTAREMTGYKEIVARLTTRGASAVPVVDDANRVVGIVTETDLLHKLQVAEDERHDELFTRRSTRAAHAKAAATTAGGLMTSPAVTISAAMSLTSAARVMDGHHVSRLPVVDDQGRLLGIVSRADLLRPFLRADADIRDEVRDEVILRTMWMNPDTIEVTVTAGIVTLEGTVERRGAVPVLISLIHDVAGVVGVVDHLFSRYDDATGRSLAPVA